jgi:imidazolonepropionase-like amidohydrolase
MSSPLHLRAVRLPDGTDPEDAWIVDGRLTDRPVPGAVDLPGNWWLPGGLTDAHVHLTMNFGRRQPFDDGSDVLMAANARSFRDAGILAVRDAGHAWGGVPRETAAGPRLQRAGSILAPPGRGYPNVCRLVESGDLVRVALEEVSAGAQWVKVLGDYPGPDGNWFGAPPNYPRDVLVEVVREVHRAGARVMAHSTGLGATDLVAAGVDAIEHGMVLTPDLVAAMADRGIAWTTTFATAYKHLGALVDQQTPVGGYIRGKLDALRELLPRALALGVPVLAGTDEVPGAALVRELEYLPRFGLTTAETLAVGSTSARAWLGFPAADVGGVADLVLYDADPRADLTVLDRPSAVVLDGVRVA